MQPDAKIFCELLAVADESWQDCVEACLGDRRFDILVPPAHYEAAKSAFVALKDKVGPISLLDTPGIRKANRHAETAPADSLAAQVTSENPLAAQYADTILRRIVCCDTPETLEQYPDSATRDLLRHHPFRLERLRTRSVISAWKPAAPAPGHWPKSWKLWLSAPAPPPRPSRT